MNNSFKRQQNNIERRMNGMGPIRMFLEDPDFLQERDQILSEGQSHLIMQLFYTNLVILLLGGGISYFLARMTLKPIEEAHEAQARFTADASHELRSPLAAMQSEIEVALRDKKLSKEEAITLLESNLEEVEKLKTLSEGLLELARDNGDSLTKEKVKIEEFVNKAIANVTKKAQEKSIVIDSKVNGFSVHGHLDSLVELITILLDNAIKYSERGKMISLIAKKENNHAVIEVSDQGKGIAKEDLPFIFDRFYRADASRSKKKEGYGLGLSIAKKIVETNHGKIEAHSESEKGSNFIITLPLA
jgi:signal transduction histidine kinase